ncbi:MAG: hypothetical protein OQK51_04690 [Kangiellaceae bacterium]|nr:hypothetical protein [Kangiellaceae bacterium]
MAISISLKIEMHLLKSGAVPATVFNAAVHRVVDIKNCAMKARHMTQRKTILYRAGILDLGNHLSIQNASDCNRPISRPLLYYWGFICVLC